MMINSARITGRQTILLLVVALLMVPGLAGSAMHADASTPNASTSESNSLPDLTHHTVQTSESRHHLLLPVHRDGEVDILRVGENGDIALLTPSGDTVWERSTMGLRASLGFRQPGNGAHQGSISNIPGSDPLAFPTQPPVVVKDFTGDGTEDVVFAERLRVHLDGIEGAPHLTVIMILDGTNGELLAHWIPPLWTDSFSEGWPNGRVERLTFEGDTLVVPLYKPLSGQALGGSVADLQLQGLSITKSSEGLKMTPTWDWRVAQDSSWTDCLTCWYGLKSTTEGMVAISYWDTKTDTFFVKGVNATTGSVTWSWTATSYPAYPTDNWILEYDASRKQVVVLTMDNLNVPGLADCYGLTALDAITGTVETTNSCIAAAVRPKALAIRDVNGDGKAEWITVDGHATLTAGFLQVSIVTSDRIVVMDGDTGLPVWTGQTRPANQAQQPHVRELVHSVPQVAPVLEAAPWYPNGLAFDRPVGITFADGNLILASYTEGLPASSIVRAFNGTTGQIAWDTSDPRLQLPASGKLLPLRSEGETLVYAMNSMHVLRAFDSGTGAVVKQAGLFGIPTAATAIDADSDGILNPIVGSDSGGVFAINASQLNLENPEVIWRASLSGYIRQLSAADVDGDGDNEIIALASSAVQLSSSELIDKRGEVVVLEANGTIRWKYTFPEDLVWASTIADVNEDGGMDIVVPTRALTALDGRTGEEIWTYRPAIDSDGTAYFANVVHTPGGTLVSQVAFVNAEDNKNDPALIGVSKTAGEIIWSVPSYTPGSIDLWNSVTAVPEWTGAGGNGVAFAYQNEGKNRVQIRNGMTGALVEDITRAVDRTILDGAWADGKLFMLVARRDMLVATPGSTEVIWARGTQLTVGNISDQPARLFALGNPSMPAYDTTSAEGLGSVPTIFHSGAHVFADFNGDAKNEMFIVSRDDLALYQVFNLLGLDYPVLHSWASGVGIEMLEAA